VDQELIAGITNAVFSLAVFALYFYYILVHKKVDELSRRFLLAGFFFCIHELTFFLGNDFVYELTKMLFFMALFYSLVFVVTKNADLKKELEEQKERNDKLKKSVEEISEAWLLEKTEA
jgi:hypothetical protein